MIVRERRLARSARASSISISTGLFPAELEGFVRLDTQALPAKQASKAGSWRRPAGVAGRAASPICKDTTPSLPAEKRKQKRRGAEKRGPAFIALLSQCYVLCDPLLQLRLDGVRLGKRSAARARAELRRGRRPHQEGGQNRKQHECGPHVNEVSPLPFFLLKLKLFDFET